MTETFLPITVDKSHLITIGERLYTQRVELVRELVNNAYDADATEVHITASPDTLTVEDNGMGMDMEGLKQYFNIGSPFKKQQPRSEKFSRNRIGQFGIGKFASLSAAKGFSVLTRNGDFCSEVIFDKDSWNENLTDWKLPIKYLPPETRQTDGTTVSLLGLTKPFEEGAIERCLMESVPLQAPHFATFLNGKRIQQKKLFGQRFPFLEGTSFGVIHGEILLLPHSQGTLESFGLEVKVKQVTVCRETFGLEAMVKLLPRIRGEVHVDFLPVTSDRTGFVKDSDEYQAFAQAMERVVESVKKDLLRLSDQRETKKIRGTLREALKRIQKALAMDSDFNVQTSLPVAKREGPGGKAGHVEVTRSSADAEQELQETSGDKKDTPVSEKKPPVRRLSPNAVVQRLRLGHEGISCCLDHFGEDGPEVFTDEKLIYVNRDHPLYVRSQKNKDTHLFHLARLLTQEIALLKGPLSPKDAFLLQSRLLRGSFSDEKSE